MTITVIYHAMLKELSGMTSEEYVLPEEADGHHLIAAVGDRHAEMGDFLSFIRLANDTAYISERSKLIDGETISLIPPVSGG